jgi:hypothetical protein
VIVPSGNTQAFVAITFAAYNAGRCRNLDEDNLCRIYERRPLVCRIYPMEINPHIPLNPAAKDCPPQSWEQTSLCTSATPGVLSLSVRLPTLAPAARFSRATATPYMRLPMPGAPDT